MKYYLYLLLSISFACKSTFNSNEKEEKSVTYYINSINGNDNADGTTQKSAFKSFAKLQQMNLHSGDTIKLFSNQEYSESLILKNIGEKFSKPLVVTTTSKDKAMINAKGFANGILLENVSNVKVENIHITANGGAITAAEKMRCGVLYTTSEPGNYQNVQLENLLIEDIFYHEGGFTRGKKEVKTANGTQAYGWGIRVLLEEKTSTLHQLEIKDIEVKNVAHTGIKLTGGGKHSILDFKIEGCKVTYTGGPGIQMSKVKDGHVFNNKVDHSGSDNDSRKWGRGSGLWTWGSDKVLIEKNRFTNANGPGDSAGAHIDYNCNNIVLQYNFSKNNAGGFLEILGNNYNCSYRYNISVNDGFRNKGQNGAFQEGKVFWLSGYQGKKERKGPFNSYIYNNTIYVKKGITSKIAVDNVANGILVMNNIFHFEEEAILVLGDQYTPDKGGDGRIDDVLFKNNIFYQKSNWPSEVLIQPKASFIVDVDFKDKNSDHIADFTPKNIQAIKNKGIPIPRIESDSIGIVYGLKIEKDIQGNKVSNRPSIGAIEVY
ncbi:right-handed parallel beta-helix repeat-containing protein [Flammeovirga pacifica]|uniref:Right handed beta helix domain-containing protein n=1 Tax=Flammeovirga pacifica TaxID=915059 RepID=A0A1S1YUH6_FLAPC|nr:right-handed parallel beta-helix repeat-containing protein [Flammeovirga pacifica]OHX64682.1 hypothetical protein NH26_24270 [Flammeovirga pacifica]